MISPRDASDLAEIELRIAELEFRITLQEDIIRVFEARGLGTAEPAKLLEELQASLQYVKVARGVLLKRSE
jgi:uncharacterized coiled-coil protein SlyX